MTSFQVAVIQFEPLFGRVSDNLERMEHLTAGVSADIFVFPELCTTGYFFRSRQEAAAVAEPADGPTRAFFRRMAEDKDAVVVAGFAEKDGARLYNACLTEIPGQKDPRVYRKTHLFYRERFCFDPGDTGFFVVRDPVRDLRIGPMICYDWRFPESARLLALQGADLIACPANLVTTAWHQVMPARAIENQVYLAVANRTGVEEQGGEKLHFQGFSRIYGCNGETLAEAGAADATVIRAEIFPARARCKSFNEFNDVFQDRRPSLYGPLTAPAEKPPDDETG